MASKAVKSTKSTKSGYTKKAKEEKKVVEEEVLTQTPEVVEEVVEPSDNIEDAISEIWDAFVLRHIMNPRVSGKREMDIYKRYKDVANSIIAAKKAEAQSQNVTEVTE